MIRERKRVRHTESVLGGGQGVVARALPPEAAAEQAHDHILHDVLRAQRLEAPRAHSPAQTSAMVELVTAHACKAYAPGKDDFRLSSITRLR